MKHIKLFESDPDDILGDLEKIGFEPFIGFIWCAGTSTKQLGFLVVGKDEEDCVNQVKSHLTYYLNTMGPGFFSSGGIGGTTRKSANTMEEYLTQLYEVGKIRDAGHYRFKARKNEALVKIFWDDYMMNPKYVYDQAQEYFTDADIEFDKEYPQEEIYLKKYK